MSRCDYWDCGRCYAPEGIATSKDHQHGCGGEKTCPCKQIKELLAKSKEEQK